MPHNITLAQFDAIASGKYSAGQIDIATDGRGAASLVKVNNHVWFPSWNNALLSSQRVLEVKEAFLEALAQGGVSPANIVAKRESANADFAIKHVADYNFHLTDAISLLSASRSLADLDDSRARHFDGPNAVNEQPQSAVGAFMSV